MHEWTIEWATPRGSYALHLRTSRAVDAFHAYRELAVINGQRKRLLRGGRVIDSHTAAPAVAQAPAAIQEHLPIAL